MDKLTYAGNLENLKDIENKENYTFVKADICDSDAINQIFDENEIDRVVHFAAESHVDRSIRNPEAVSYTHLSIGVNNLSKKLKISYGDVEEIQMRFRGAQEALNVLDIQNAVSIDLKNYYTAGTYEIPVSVSIPNTVEWEQQPVIKIVLTEKKGE